MSGQQFDPPLARDISLILAVGELVWDIFPDQRVLGGAPVNVAYHLARLGLPVESITRIGDDPLGVAACQRLGELGLSVAGIQQDAMLPTGQVRVSFDAKREPHFDIVAPAAWDAIALEPALQLAGDQSFALLFGTLAQRDPRSRQAIGELRDRARLICYDVNLRPPFTTKELVRDSLVGADLVKLNGHELAILGDWLELVGDKKNIAKTLCSRYDLAAVAVTEGAGGAWLVAGDEFFADPALPVTVADTVGAGDAFFAGLIEGFLRKRPWLETLKRANQRGAYVASRRGATPPMPDHLSL